VDSRTHKKRGANGKIKGYVNLRIWKEPRDLNPGGEDDEDHIPETPLTAWKAFYLIATVRSILMSRVNDLNGLTSMNIDIATGIGITKADLMNVGTGPCKARKISGW
jgi:hypothetical protein